MDPRAISAEQWGLVNRALLDLLVFAGLALNAASALLLGRAIIPSLIASADAPPRARGFRWALYPIAALSCAAMLYALARALLNLAGFLQQFFPRLLV